MIRKFVNSALIGVVFMAAVIAVGAHEARADQDPMGVVKGLVDPALQILRDNQSPLKDRQEKLRQLVRGAVDFTAISRSALGPHWRDLSDQQRQDFIQVFTDFIEDSYLSRIQDYSGQQVEFVKAATTDPGYAQVFTNIVQEGKQPIQINYLLKQNSPSWKIYDITVDNISIIANYRNQFNRVINNKGFDTLMTDLRSKQQALAAQLGTPHPHD